MIPVARLAQRIGAVAAGGIFLSAIVPALTAPVSVTFRLCLAGLVALGIAAPVTGLLLLCGFMSVAAILGTMWGLPWRGTQVSGAMTMALLAGWCLRLSVKREAPPGFVQPPLIALAALAIGSALVVSAGIEKDPAIGAGPQWLNALRTYMVHHPPYLPLYGALHLVAGLAIVAVCSAVSKERPAVRTSVVRMLTVGIMAAAALNVVRFLQVVTATEDPLRYAQSYLRWVRINTQYGDVNAAGSVFAMALLVSFGLIRSSAGLARALWASCAVILGAALWLAGSRTAIGAALLTAPAACAWIVLQRRESGWRPHMVYVGGAAAITVAVLLVAGSTVLRSSRFAGNADPSSAWSIRTELLVRGVRMIKDNPAFGVGVGRFFAESDRYATPGSFGPENAHNNFTQVAAELGIPGLLLFIWLLAAALRPALIGSAAESPTRHVDVWLCAGLCAYLLSSLAGHPLIVWEAALPFWVLLGVAATGSPGARGGGRRIAAVVIALVLLSLPFRMPATTDTGAAQTTWHSDGPVRFRNVGEYDSIRIRRPTASIEMPLRLSVREGASGYADVVISVDGIEVNRIVVLAERWSPVRVNFPRQPGYADRRIELRLERHPPGASLLVGRLTFLN